jgi:sulfatase modifying factor 1
VLKGAQYFTNLSDVMMRCFLFSGLTMLISCSDVIAQSEDLGNMTFIEGGSFFKGQNLWTSVDDIVDSTYLYHTIIERKRLSNFYLSSHEVTNEQYWEFVNWVQDSVARKRLFEVSKAQQKEQWGHYVDYETKNVDAVGRYFVLNWETPLHYNNHTIKDMLLPLLEPTYYYSPPSTWQEPVLAIEYLTYCFEFLDEEPSDVTYDKVHVYPNTKDWTHTFPYGLEDIKDNYFTTKMYLTYPVVGVSCIQAKAYCHWKTAQFQKEYNTLSPKQKKYFSSNGIFRLPTEAEWEYAANNPDAIYRENVGYEKKDGQYQANFGPIVLSSRLHLKWYADDGAFNSAPVGSYPPNSKGLYDLFGNVSEWTSDPVHAADRKFYSIHKSRVLQEDFKPYSYLDEKNQLYITNPITNETKLVVQYSEEHLRLLNLRSNFFAVNPKDSKEEIMRKYIACNTVDSLFYDSIKAIHYRYLLGFPSIAQEFDTANTIFGDVELVHPKLNVDDHYYCNVTGDFYMFDSLDSLRVVNLIDTYKHDHAVFNRASSVKCHGYDRTKNRIVKGGSWADQPHYLIPASREVYNEAESSCKVGFRMAMDAPATIAFLSNKDKKRLKKLRELQKDDLKTRTW